MNKTVAIIGGGPVGLFMSRLLLLNGIDNIVFEKNVLRNAHAKAHFLNLRTMEIFRSTMPNICKKIQNIVPPSELWRFDTSYSPLNELCTQKLCLWLLRIWTSVSEGGSFFWFQV